MYRYIENMQEQRVRLLHSKAVKPFIDTILQGALSAMQEDVCALKMSEYLLFYQTGNRRIFERKYFDRRRGCYFLAAALWLTEEEKYLLPLIDYINYICDEFTWCVPAHAKFTEQSVKDVVEHIDLFQSETARLFAEIIMCVGDRLPEYVCQRMRDEVQRRIFPSLLAGKPYKWAVGRSNWVAVCSAGCALATLYFATPEQKKKLLPLLFHGAQQYLSGIHEDGCCKEGMAYWDYGCSHLVILADIIKYCGGPDYFDQPKVRNLALFPQRIRMSESKVASISDGLEQFSFRVGHMSFLKSIYPEVCRPDLKYGTIRGNVNSFWDLLWLDTDYTSDEMEMGYHFFEDSQWYVIGKEKYSFVAKGGTNKEPHNHNDVGSFMITVGEQTMISDLGCGEYVKATFEPQTRYTFVQNCSRGHSVPIVEGKYQLPGKEYAAKNVSATDHTFALDMEGAYESGLCDRLHRTFTFSEDRIILQDTVSGAHITERFISKREPKLEEGYVDLGCGGIVYDSTAYDVTVNVDSFTSHGGDNIIPVYQIDFSAKDAEREEFVFEFVF